MSETVVYIYVGLSLLTIVVLAVFLYRCETKTCSNYTHVDKTDREKDLLNYYYNRKEHDNNPDKCICSPHGSTLCANRLNTRMSYVDGNTEYQDFARNQKYMGGPIWKNSNFGNLNR